MLQRSGFKLLANIDRLVPAWRLHTHEQIQNSRSWSYHSIKPSQFHTACQVPPSHDHGGHGRCSRSHAPVSSMLLSSRMKQLLPCGNCRQIHSAAAALYPFLPICASSSVILSSQRIVGIHPATQWVLGRSYFTGASDEISSCHANIESSHAPISSMILSRMKHHLKSGNCRQIHSAAATLGSSFSPRLPVFTTSSIISLFQRIVGIHPAAQLVLGRSYCRGGSDHDQRSIPTGIGQMSAGKSMLSSRAFSNSDTEKMETKAIKGDGKKLITVQRGATQKAIRRDPKEDQATPASDRDSGPPAFLRLAAEVDTICSILGELEQAWTPQTESALEMTGIQIRPSHVIRVLERQQLNPALALRFFDWAARQPGCEHNSSTYNALLGILGRAKMFADAEKVLQQMERKSIIKTRLVLSTLATSYGTAGMEKEALESVNQMKNLGVRPNVYSYNSLMTVLAKAGFHEKVQFVYSHMLGAGCPPDIYTFGILISAFVRAGELERAFKTFAEMKLQAFQPNVVVYTSLINGLCKAGQLEKAGALFVEMNKKGCTPNTFTYNALLDGLGKSGRIVQAGKLFAEMIEVGCVDAVSYKLNTQFSMLGKAGLFKSGVKY